MNDGAVLSHLKYRVAKELANILADFLDSW